MSDLTDELIAAYEDILTCKHVESWIDDMDCVCHEIFQESAIKIANRLLELDPNNVLAIDTRDREEWKMKNGIKY